MAKKQKQSHATHVTAAQAKVVVEREKRLAEALRENLKRRRPVRKEPKK